MSNLPLSSGSLLFILFLLISIISFGSSYLKSFRKKNLMKQIPAGAPLSIFFFLIIIIFLVIYYQKFPRQQQSATLNNQAIPTKEAQISTVQKNYSPLVYGKVDSIAMRNIYSKTWQQQAKPAAPAEYSGYGNRPTINRMIQNPDTIIKPTWRTGFAVQAAAFQDEAAAIKYALALYEKFDLPVVWYEGTDQKGEVCYRVLIGVFSNKQAADQFAQTLPRYGFRKGFKVDLSEMNLTPVGA